MVENLSNNAADTGDTQGKKSDVIRDNAPRIVGAMKFVPDVFLFMSGLKDTGKARFRSAAAIGFMASRSLLLAFGTKDKKKSDDHAVSHHHDDTSLSGRLEHNLYKVTHPSQYPVEAGAGVAALAGVSVALSGAAQMRNKKTFKEGIIELGVGIFTTLAEGNVLFSKEKAKTATAETTNKPDTLIQKFKDQPVLLSGITQAAISGSQIGLGLLTLARSKKDAAAGEPKRWYYLAAASIYTAADLVYAFLVRKNEFNVEAAKTPAANTQPESPQNLPLEPASQSTFSSKTTPKPSWEQSVQRPSGQDRNAAIA